MATAPILYVGEDTCFRIPVLERAGAVVRRSDCSRRALREVFADAAAFSALTFHQDTDPIPEDVLALVQSFPAPLILFENPAIQYDRSFFDLIIPSLVPPGYWLHCLQFTIAESQRLHATSRALRKDAAQVRAATQEQRARMHRLLPSPIDIDEIWCTDSNTDAFGPGRNHPLK